MKNYYRLLGSLLPVLFACTIASAQLSGTFTVGPTGSYPSITAALTDIGDNGGMTGAGVILELQSTYTSAGETFPISFGPIVGATAGSPLIIRPKTGATGLLISSAVTSTASNSRAGLAEDPNTQPVSGTEDRAPVSGTNGPVNPSRILVAPAGTIDLNGANYVIFDGRPGGTGTAKQLTIENTTATGVATRFINGASNNTFRYLTIQGVNTSTAVIVFDTTNTASGNNNNTIDHCDVRDGATTPAILILGNGSTASASVYNTGITISNNNLYNFWADGGTAEAIYINTGCTGWTITGNSMYQTTTRTSTAGTGSGFNPIIIVPGDNYVITNNYIGGKPPNAGGTAWTVGGTLTNFFYGIRLILTGTTSVSVQGNTIANINLTTTPTSSGTIWMAGYFVQSGANVDVGSVSPNVFGSQTGTGSINFTMASAKSGTLRGIDYRATPAGPLSNFSAGSITTGGATGDTLTIELIRVSNLVTSAMTISNCTAGSATIANSVQTTSPTGSTITWGFSLANSGTTTVSNCLVANLTNNASLALSQIKGVYFSGTGTPTISGCTVRGLSTSSINTTLSNGEAALVGIHWRASSVGGSITRDTVYGLACTNTGAVSTSATGIGATLPTSAVVTRNLVYGITNASTGTTATAPPTASGIMIRSATTAMEISNNMISLGAGQTTNTEFVGIWNNSTAAGTLNIYYNSVDISGTAASGALPSFGFLRGNNTTTSVTSPLALRNNIFNNVRGGGTGKQYAIGNQGTTASTNWTATTSDYNDLYSSTPATVGFWNATDQTLATWQSTSLGDANSKYDAVAYAYTVNSVSGDLHLTGISIGDHQLIGTLVSVTIDFDGDSRDAAAPYMGADEVAGSPLPIQLASFTARANPAGNGVLLNWRTLSEVRNYGFYVERKQGDRPDFTELPNSFVAGSGTTNLPHDYTFVDQTAGSGTWNYRLKQVDLDGTVHHSEPVQVTTLTAVTESTPRVFLLSQNYPNPFNPSTEIKFSVDNTSRSTLELYNLLGQRVATLFDGVAEAGQYYKVTLNAGNLASGMYFYRLQSGVKSDLKKLLLLK